MNIAYLFGRKFYDHKMSRGRVVYGRAMGRQPGVRCEFWGAGWPDYDERATVRENLQARYNGKLDVVWGYKPEDHREFDRSGLFTFVCFNEMHFDAVMPEVRALNARLVVIHHETDIDKHRQAIEADGRRWLHLPHAADPTIFAAAALPWAVRDIPFLVVGAVGRATYPLRAKLREAVQRGLIPGGFVHPHPGHNMKTAAACDAQLLQYAEFLGRAKLVACCASVYNYGLAKYVEAAMAGAAVLGDVPPDFPQLSPHIVACRREESLEALAARAREALADDAALQRRAAASQRVALEHYAVDGYCQKLLAEIRRLRGR